MRILLLTATLVGTSSLALDARAQLVITPETDAADLVQGLLGPGVTYVPGTATLSTPGGGLTVSLDPFNEVGPPWSTSGLASTGVFQNGPLGLGGGVTLSTGDVASFSESNTVLPTRDGVGGWDNVTGPGISGAWGTATGVSSGLCADLVGLGNAYDETRLSFEVDVAVGSAGVVFEYAFGSEEYPAYVGGVYNDAFGLYVVPTGNLPSIADNIGLDGGGDPININGPFFSSGNVVESFILSGETVSANPSFGAEYNGFTPKLQTRKALAPGQYRVDIVICDGGDQTLDSGVFIGSLSAFADCPNGQCEGTGVCGNGTVEGGESCDDGNLDETDGCDNACRSTACLSDADCDPGRSCNTGDGLCYDGLQQGFGPLSLVTFDGVPVSADLLALHGLYGGLVMDPNPDGAPLSVLSAEVFSNYPALGGFSVNSGRFVDFVPSATGYAEGEVVLCRETSNICASVPINIRVLPQATANPDTIVRSSGRPVDTTTRPSSEQIGFNDTIPSEWSGWVSHAYEVDSGPGLGSASLSMYSDGHFFYFASEESDDAFEYAIRAVVNFSDFTAEGFVMPTSRPSAQVSVELNAAPVATEDPRTVFPGSVLAIDVLTNDSDPEGGSLRVVSVSGPWLGSATFDAGSVYYTAPGPEDDWVGQEVRFSYEVCDDGPDGGSCMTADVVVTFPTPPSAGELKVGTWVDASVEVDVPLIRGHPDYEATIVGATSGNFNEVEVLGDPDDFRNRIRLTARNQSLDTVTLTVCDNREICSTASLQVFVEYPPIAEVEVTNPYPEVDATTWGVFLTFNRNAWDNPFWVLGATEVTDPPDHGSLSVEGQFLRYMPTGLVTGPSGHAEDAFTVRVYGAKTREGDGFVYGEVPFAQTTVNLQIERSPNSPPFYQGPGLGLFAGQSFTFDLAPYLSDDQNDPVTSIEVLANSGNTLQSAVVNGTQLTLQAFAALSTSGQGALTLKLCDARGCNESASLSYVVHAVPQATDDTLWEVTEGGTGISELIEKLMLNDSAPDGYDIEITASPTHGQLDSWTYSVPDALPRTPGPLADGFTYRLTGRRQDGHEYDLAAPLPFTEAEVVIPLNRRPAALDDLLEVQPDTFFSAPVLANDSDPDNDPLAIANSGWLQVSGPSLTGFAPTDPGDYTYDYTVCDDGLDSGCDQGTLTLRVLPPEVCYCSEGDPLVIHVIVNDREGEPAGTATCTLVSGAITCPTRPDGTLDVDTDTLLCSL